MAKLRPLVCITQIYKLSFIFRILLIQLIIILLFTVDFYGQTQPFEDILADLKDVVDASIAWGDYDNDGDLDILLTGSVSSIPVSVIIQNEGGGNFKIKANLTGITKGSVDWGDYDNDGDLDIAVTGLQEVLGLESPFFSIFKNDNGNFSDIGMLPLHVSKGSVAWGDYDNDGDLDIVLTGFFTELQYPFSKRKIAIIVRNNGTTFEEVDVGLTGVQEGSAIWGDYDNDGDLDILLTGQSDSGPISKIYKNTNGKFIDINALLTGVFYSSVDWGDYDSDGDLDILLIGESNSGPISKIYRNDDGNFVNINVMLTGVRKGSAAWGDYNNDGNLDILLTGQSNSGPVTRIYRNDNGQFVDINANLPGISRGSAIWGDFDNDGDLDILLAGSTMSIGSIKSAESSTSKIFRNNITIPNNIPTMPTILTSSVRNDSVTLSWNESIDAETNSISLTYNLRVGVTPGSMEVISPMSDGESGYRRIPYSGNTNHNNAWTIKNLLGGNYFWSVQAIDHAFAGSIFAMEATFSVPAEGSRPPDIIKSFDDPILLIFGESPLDINLNKIFKDPDGDKLKFEITFGSDEIARAIVKDSIVTIESLTPGNTSITFTADDNNGCEINYTTNIIVDQRPIVLNPIADTTLILPGDPFLRNLDEQPVVFLDPDEEPLIYEADPIDPSIAMANVSNNLLTVGPMKSGKTQIIVTAMDSLMVEVQDTFKVEVNSKPRENVGIPDTTLTIGRNKLTRILSDSPVVFIDDDDVMLCYSAYSSDSTIAKAEISVDTLTVIPLTSGEA
ncbi:MAG: FG-GAP repeat domain-containing protein, partial [Candidatus Hodarchaeota archaeon]